MNSMGASESRAENISWLGGLDTLEAAAGSEEGGWGEEGKEEGGLGEEG